jgi:hypothetical protein
MKKTELREFVGLLAIFLGLVFVGLEMRQNTKMMRAQIRNSMTENTMEYVGWSATSEALAEAVAINRQEGAAELTPSQYHMVRAWAGAQMREWENSFYQNKLGLFTEAEFGARKNIWRQRMTTGARREIYRRLWMDLAETFAPDFRDEIDRIIAAEKTGE